MKSTVLTSIGLAFSVLISTGALAQSNSPQLGKDPVPAIIKAMTLEDKVKVLVGKGFKLPGLDMGATDNTPDKVEWISGYSIPNPKFGIPSVRMADGPAGIHRLAMSKKDSADNLYSTAWPVGTLLASSWDTALVRRVGVAFGEEIKSYGIDFILGPGANIHRNPLGGRNFEYYSEDPLVSGATAAAIINGIQSQGVGATLKHFAVNNQETDRMSVNEIVSERALREIYLRNFEIAVKASQPWAIMTSYNMVNGTYTSESNELVTKILRDEWGYKGMVMTDWFGGKDAVAQMKAGNNLLMPGTSAQIKMLTDAVKNGQLSEAVLDKNVENILRVWLRTPTVKGDTYNNQANLKAHAQIAREAAAESMILLKNTNNALPIAKPKASIALFGKNGYELIAGGTGSGDVNKPYAISLAEGLPNTGYSIDSDLAKRYKDYLADYVAKHPKKSMIQEFMHPTPFAPELAFEESAIAQKAESADVAIIYIGRNAGEGSDRKVADDYTLSDLEKGMVTAVSNAFHGKHKPVVAVLNTGGVIDLSPLRDQVDAILLAWQPGEEGGNAIADILSGKVNPSGKLATTFPAAYTDDPTSKNFPGKEFPEKAVNGPMGKSIPAEVTYAEGIYVGYRYYTTFNVKPAYEFGFGLSYTTFSYTGLKLSSTAFNNELTATVTVTNTGKVAGKEVAQLYLTAPSKKLDKPAEELKGFAKTSLLQPGQSQTLKFTLQAADLASFNTDASSWIADAGKYTVKIGASSLNIKQTGAFTLAKELVVEKVHKALAPTVAIDELKAK